MKKRLGPVERLYPMPCALVVGGTLADANIMAVSRTNVVSSTPPTLVAGIRSTRRTLESIRDTQDFSVNIPGTALAAEVDLCGIETGRTIDKLEATGLTLASAALISAPIIEECRYNLECRVTREVAVGEYVSLFGEIVEAHAASDVLGDDGATVDVTLLDPLVYIAGMREYHRLGGKVADAYSVGKSLLPGQGRD
jgi:flavin reductase (DIM6/NTAB) family NADH-FMN oxidoreductase RutF